MGTKLISEQFKTQGIIVPTHRFDSVKLMRIENLLAKQPLQTPEQALMLLPKHKGKTVFLKNMQNQQFISVMPRSISSFKSFLATNPLDAITTVKFNTARITGPLSLQINNVPYQLYLASRERGSRFGSWLYDLPIWIRIAIPVLISFILYWFVARALTKPLVAMQRAAKQLGDGQLSARVPLKAQRNDEIGDCAVSFNLMAEKLEHNIAAHQRLLADVSHELRSPMARLQIALGLAQGKNIDQQSLHKHLQRCETEVSRLDDMVAKVLTLSRMENTISQMELMELNINELLTLCIEDAQYLANEKAIHINFEKISTVIINADAQLLSSALSNVLVNAVKYSFEHSIIDVTIAHEHKRIKISISDQGIGVSETELAMLFEPFYRVAPARDRETGGTGLGLAIAKQAIDAHQGQIKAMHNKPQGLTVTIELPLEISKNS